jgi:predicted alpha/beta superfamily hydrolase
VLPDGQVTFSLNAPQATQVGLSLGGLWTLDTLLLEPGDFASLGVFSSGWFPRFRDNPVQNHSDLLTNPAINKKTKMFWITIGGPEDITRGPCGRHGPAPTD